MNEVRTVNRWMLRITRSILDLSFEDTSHRDEFVKAMPIRKPPSSFQVDHTGSLPRWYDVEEFSPKAFSAFMQIFPDYISSEAGREIFDRIEKRIQKAQIIEPQGEESNNSSAVSYH